MTHATLLLGHADDRSFNTALARAYADGLAERGVQIDVFTLATLEFDPVVRVGHAHDQPLEPDLVRVKDSIDRARHLVLAFPTYWASPPAIVRGLVDRLFLPGWAFRYEGAALPTGLLRGRSARVIATMDSPSWWYALVHRRSLHATVGTATLSFCGIRPTRFTTVHHVRELDPATRERRRAALRELGRKDARGMVPALAADIASSGCARDRGRRFPFGRCGALLRSRSVKSHVAEAFVCEVGEDGLAHPLRGGDPIALRAEAPATGSLVLVRDGAIERVLAPPSSALARMHRLAAQHGVTVAFPPAVEAEVEAWEAAPDLDDPELVDLEALPFVTIDGEGSRDLDQALYVSREGDGHRVLYALADAAHYVPPGSALFEEALARGASYYLPGLSVPMLPRALSEGLVSLNPDVPRRAVLFDLRLDERGVCVHAEVYRVRIRSRAKLDWARVQRLYDGGGGIEPEIDASLEALREVGERRVKLAEERGVLRYRRTELDLTLDGVGFAVHESPRLAVERYNEQLSLLTNIEGAKLLRDAGMLHVEGIYRVHPAPDPSRYESFAGMLAALASAHELDPARWTWRPEDDETLAAFLDRLPSDGDEGRLARAIHRQAVLLNVRSIFTTEPDRHFGVGADVYARFSSPMREIVGVFLHRELLERLKREGGRDDGLRQAVVSAANRAKERQRAIDDESLRFAIDALVASAPDEGFAGTVMGFTSAKVHVALDAPPVDVKVYTLHLRRQLNAPLFLDHDGTILRTEPGGDVVCRLGEAVRVKMTGRDAKRDRWIFELERR